MKSRLACAALALALGWPGFFGANNNNAQAQRRRGRRAETPRVCGDPTQPCPTLVKFEPHQLPFRIREYSVIDETEQFYAVVLQSVRYGESNCERTVVAEVERRQAQNLFPRNKVFTSRCYDAGELYYTGVSPNTNFMAVFAGRTRAEAERVLEQVRATGQFRGASLRRMRAGFNGT